MNPKAYVYKVNKTVLVIDESSNSDDGLGKLIEKEYETKSCTEKCGEGLFGNTTELKCMQFCPLRWYQLEDRECCDLNDVQAKGCLTLNNATLEPYWDTEQEYTSEVRFFYDLTTTMSAFRGLVKIEIRGVDSEGCGVEPIFINDVGQRLVMDTEDEETADLEITNPEIA